MSQARLDTFVSGVVRPKAATHRAADGLALAAAPAFAIMALLTEVTGGTDMICSSTPGVSPLSGMALMYLLMAAVHLVPWLRLVASRGVH